jgi:DHA2 family multidrug resistance protein-like MFS transporter
MATNNSAGQTLELATTEKSLAKAGRREWLGLAVLALPTLLLSLDVSVLYLALPHISMDLGANSIQQLWILDMYGFVLAGFLVTMGTLGDRIGRRKLLLFGASIFGLASILAAFSTSPGMLIATRAILGVAGATLMPSTLGLIRNMFRDPKQMGQAIGIWTSCFMGGTIIGPLIGGILLDHFWWGSAFLLGVPVMVLLLILGPLLLPEHRSSEAAQLDLASVALSLATILPVIYGLKELARSGWQILPIFAIITGIAIGAVFLRRQQELAQPLLDLHLFRNRSFSIALSTGLVSGVVMGGAFLFITLYLQVVAGLSPLSAGLMLLPQAVAMIVSSNLVPIIARRIGLAYVMAAGFLISAAGFLMITQVASSNGLLALVSGFVILSFGLADGARHRSGARVCYSRAGWLGRSYVRNQRRIGPGARHSYAGIYRYTRIPHAACPYTPD